VGCPRRAGVTGAEEEGGSGARVSGCYAAELRQGIEWLRAGEAQEQEVRARRGCTARATVAARWRPADGSGGRGACNRGLRRGGIGPGQGERDAWKPT
jgi:hypothetical protein